MTIVYVMRGTDAVTSDRDTWPSAGTPDPTGAHYAGILATPLRFIHIAYVVTKEDTSTAASFVMPTLPATSVNITLLEPEQVISGMYFFVAGAGHFRANSFTGAVCHATQLPRSGDAASGTTISAGATVNITGAEGVAGTNGTNGAAGTNGTNGTNGAPGAAGATGPMGPEGLEGFDFAGHAAVMRTLTSTEFNNGANAFTWGYRFHVLNKPIPITKLVGISDPGGVGLTLTVTIWNDAGTIIAQGSMVVAAAGEQVITIGSVTLARETSYWIGQGFSGTHQCRLDSLCATSNQMPNAGFSAGGCWYAPALWGFLEASGANVKGATTNDTARASVCSFRA